MPKPPTSFRLAEVVQEMLDLLAERDGMTKTAAVEQLIRKEFRARRYSLTKKKETK